MKKSMLQIVGTQSLGISVLMGFMATSARSQIADPIGQIGDTVAGINLAVGEGGGIASCGADNVILEGTEHESGESRIRIYFRDLQASVGPKAHSARSTCILRLRESHLAESKLTLVYAQVVGSSEISSSIDAKIGLSVSSSGSQLALANIQVPVSPSGIGGTFSIDPVTHAVSTECFQHDQSGFFGINVALSMLSRRGSLGSISADRLDLYVKEEPCQ